MLISPIGDDCPIECNGRQRDGTCLADLVRGAEEWPVFELDHEGYWVITDG